jgi:hypothetical protein
MSRRKNPTQYAVSKDTWVTPKEHFFVAYAVGGPMVVPSQGLRAGLPVDHPLPNSPVKEPSPLNTRWIYNPGEVPINDIL